MFWGWGAAQQALAKAFQGGHRLQTHRLVLEFSFSVSLNQWNFFFFFPNWILLRTPGYKQPFSESLPTPISGSALSQVLKGSSSSVLRPNLVHGLILSGPGAKNGQSWSETWGCCSVLSHRGGCWAPTTHSFGQTLRYLLGILKL